MRSLALRVSAWGVCVALFASCADDATPATADRGRAADLFPWVPDLACTGCYSNTICVAGTSPTACGTAGGVCQVCGASQQCQNGSCTGGSTCGSSSCAAGCCSSADQCVDPPTAAACGVGGKSCVACKSGERCSSSGQCEATTTCSSTCKGCCDGESCKDGTSDALCGKSGDSCQQCSSGWSCVSQTCVDLSAATYKVVLKSAAILFTSSCLPPLSACDSAVELSTGSCNAKSKYVYDNNNPLYNEVLCPSVPLKNLTSSFSGTLRDPNGFLGENTLCGFNKPPAVSDVTAGSYQVECSDLNDPLSGNIAKIIFDFVKN